MPPGKCLLARFGDRVQPHAARMHPRKCPIFVARGVALGPASCHSPRGRWQDAVLLARPTLHCRGKPQLSGGTQADTGMTPVWGGAKSYAWPHVFLCFRAELAAAAQDPTYVTYMGAVVGAPVAFCEGACHHIASSSGMRETPRVAPLLNLQCHAGSTRLLLRAVAPRGGMSPTRPLGAMFVAGCFHCWIQPVRS